MKRSSIAAALLASAALLAAAVAVVRADVVSSPHRLTGAARQDCLLCHPAIPAYRGAGATAELRGDVDRVCSSCHDRIRKVITHRVGTKPLIPIPADFPLDQKGQMSCVTCHVVHGPDKPRAFLLRKGVTGKAFCQFCHAEDIFWKDIAPTFTAQTITGRTVDLGAHLKKRTIILAFFSYSSMSSVRQLGAVEAAVRKYGEAKVNAVGISTDYLVPVETIRGYISSLDPPPSYGVVVDGQSSLIELFSVKAVPMLVVIDTYGKIRLRLSGWTPEDRDKLFSILDQLT